MQEPFDLTIANQNYAIFPEGDDTYTVFKNGTEYVQIVKDTAAIWLKLDYKTEMPIFEEDEEVNAIGKMILAYQANGGDDVED